MVIQGIEVKKGLIIGQPWIDLILDGYKTWEMRTTGTKFRGEFALIQKGTGLIVGISNLVDSLAPLSPEELIVFKHKHNVDYEKQPELLNWNTPWVMENSRRIPPIRYKHRQGAVIWVSL